MAKVVISVEHLTKKYDLGVIGAGTLARDLERWWARLRGRPDPSAKIGLNPARGAAGDTILALDDVSFTVEQGDTLGIIGKNGAGKSTLLKILSRVTAPGSGRVRVRGRIGSLLEVGTGFHPELTGRENVFLNGAILGMKRAEVQRKFDEIVDFSGVEKFIDTPVKRYSSGMYVRLAFAVAAHLDPEILIVDEVLAVGDAEFQKKCLGKMGDVASEGRTVLFVSHNIGSIKQLCHSGIYLAEGAVRYQGEINDCIDEYLNQNRRGSRRIIDHLTYQNEAVQIHQIKINEQEFDNCSLKALESEIRIEFFGQVTKALPIDLEVHVRDLYGNPLAFYSPGHVRGYAETVEPDDFYLSRTITLPDRITRGEYDLDLSLTNPNKNRWVNIPSALRLLVEGFPTETGQMIEYKSGAGWIIL